MMLLMEVFPLWALPMRRTFFFAMIARFLGYRKKVGFSGEHRVNPINMDEGYGHKRVSCLVIVVVLSALAPRSSVTPFMQE